MNTTKTIKEFVANMPKVEIHVHLEGSIPLEALWKLVEKYGGQDQVPTIQDLRRKFEFVDFPHFLDVWVWKDAFLREAEDFEFISGQIAQDFINQNIRYVEAHICRPGIAQHQLDVQQLVSAVRKGLDPYAERITFNLIIDLVRQADAKEGMYMLEQIAEVQDLGVVGIGLGGAEHLFPPELFTQAYERARKLGLKTTAHAGEAAGPTSVWGAITALQVD